jgi:glycosyltransferase involved in cell wall biosynthesis
MREKRMNEKTKKPRVLHLITSFEVGGAERQAVELLKRIDRRRFDVSLAALLRELNLDEGAKLIGLVARLQPVKGHRYFIEAASRIAAVEPKAHFLLVGDGALRREIEEQAARLGAGDRVHLLGARSDAALIAAGFDVAVLASLHEGLPNAVMEAMAAGAPVVATAVGGTAELVIDGATGFLAPPADADALAQRILDTLQNPELSARMAAQGRRRVLMQFSMRRMVESVERLYEEIVDSIAHCQLNRRGA